MSEMDRTHDAWVIGELHRNTDDSWEEYREWRDEIAADRRYDHETSLHQGCVVCMERDGKGIYGGKCRRCFEAQRDEREAA